MQFKIKEATKQGYAIAQEGDSINLGMPNSKTRYRIRRLTPIECARLQGFPDDWHGDTSDSQAYRCYGNAVSVPVVKAIAERLKP